MHGEVMLKLSSRTRKVIGIIFGIITIICFTVWRVPSIWNHAPVWLYWALTPFGVSNVFRVPSFLAAILALILMLTFSKYRLIDCHVKTVSGIFQIIINTWAFGLLLELVLGRFDSPFDGGILSIIFVASYALTILGRTTVIPYATIIMFGLLLLKIAIPIVNMILADRRLFVPGYFGVISFFLSLALQFEDFLPRLKEIHNVIVREK